jgi:hypothetical protein
MKNLIQKIFFGMVFMGQYSVYGEFESLKKRSPFGDAAPQPIVIKSQPKVNLEPKPPPLPPPPPPPKKPDLKVEFSGYLKINKKEYFSICDKTSKDPIHTVIENHTISPLGYEAFNYDKNKQVLNLKVDGHSYSYTFGEADKKTNTGTNLAVHNMGGTSPSSFVNGHDDFNWDDFDDWDDNWWDDWNDDDW